jgi:hypothetical protein
VAAIERVPRWGYRALTLHGSEVAWVDRGAGAEGKRPRAREQVMDPTPRTHALGIAALGD